MWQLVRGGSMDTIKILVVSLLGIAGIMDIKWKKVNLLVFIPFIVAGILCNLIYKVISPASILGGMAIGILILIISFVTRGKIGSGDGAILIVTGLFLGFFDNLFMLLSAAFLVAIVGAVFLLIKGVNKNYEIPFIPFLFISFIGDLILWS